MVELNFQNGKFFRLSIIDYEFPEVDEFANSYDKNWLMVQIEVKAESGLWKKQAPVLLTWELESFAEELKSASEKNIAQEKEVLFLEPNLSFELIPQKNTQIIMRLYLDAEFKPEKFKDRGRFCLEGEFSVKDLSIISNQLHEQLGRFPER